MFWRVSSRIRRYQQAKWDGIVLANPVIEKSANTGHSAPKITNIFGCFTPKFTYMGRMEPTTNQSIIV
jgi:hypothetical protein